MAKKTAAIPSSSSASQASKQKAAPAATSSIDDIFAAPKAKKPKLESSAAGPSKPEGKPSKKEKIRSTAPTDALGSVADAVGEKKKKKKKKSVTTFIPGEDASEPESKVETVVDPSTIPAPIPAPPAVVPSKNDKGKRKTLKRNKDEVDDDEIFRDSRGNGPRRQTEEGFLIFKEAELKIDPEAGGTPLCPFDCDCCF